MVLAAGASRRAGGCKALFRWSGRSYLVRVIETLEAAGAEETVVVIAPPWGPRIAEAVSAFARVRTVENATPERGMFESVRCGLDALRGEGHVAVALVDHPSVSAQTLRTLRAACGPMDIARPRFGRRHGHPIVLGSVAAAALQRIDAPTLRHALPLAGELVSVDVTDAAVLEDRDGPAHAPWLSAPG